MKPMIVAAITAIVALSAMDAQAAVTKPGAQKSQVVEFGDLDLNRTKGAASLYTRLSNAAREVCKPEVERYFLSAWRGYRGCVDKSLADAIAKVGNQNLTAYAAGRTQRIATQS